MENPFYINYKHIDGNTTEVLYQFLMALKCLQKKKYDYIKWTKARKKLSPSQQNPLSKNL